MSDADVDSLRAAWAALLEPFHRNLIQRYTEAGRHYHTLTHLTALLAQAVGRRRLAVFLDADLAILGAPEEEYRRNTLSLFAASMHGCRTNATATVYRPQPNLPNAPDVRGVRGAGADEPSTGTRKPGSSRAGRTADTE